MFDMDLLVLIRYPAAIVSSYKARIWKVPYCLEIVLSIVNVVTKGDAMHEQIQTRLNELRQQFELGQAELQKLQAQENYLRETILRISGAIQILEEMLGESQLPIQNGNDKLQTNSNDAKSDFNTTQQHFDLSKEPGVTA